MTSAPHPAPPPFRSRSEVFRVAVPVVLIVAGLLALSRESFWIDECCTYHFAGQPTLRAMWQELVRLKYAELQAPLYMGYIWLWEHLFGSGEWVMRLAGLPWFVLGGASFVTAFPHPRHRVFGLLVVALSPFAWFYLNEARPYAVQLGFSFLVVSALVRLKAREAEGVTAGFGPLALFCGSLVLLSMLSMLGMIWAGAAVLALPALFPMQTLWRWVRTQAWLFAGTAALLAACAGYYLWTRSLGARASLGTMDVKTVLFIAFEELGFNGLGPGRLALRAEGVAALRPWLPLLLSYGLCLMVLGGAAARVLMQKHRRSVLLTAAAAAAPGLFLLAIGFALHFRVLGRHFAPSVVLVLLLLTYGTAELWRGAGWRRAVVGGFLALSLFSCLSQRFAARQAKDDYRQAAAIAKAHLQQHEHVWWSADYLACEYYEVPAAEEAAASGQARIVVNPPAGFAAQLPKPDVVLASKPDLYDLAGGLRAFLDQEGYVAVQRFPAFTVFAKSPSRTH